MYLQNNIDGIIFNIYIKNIKTDALGALTLHVQT